MTLEISIANRKIGTAYPPYVIAELSANHNGSVETAIRLIDEAKQAGADAVKLQTYTPDTITLDSQADDFQIHGGLWDGRTLYELYAQAHMPWEWHKPLFDHARKVGITIFSSPFDNSAVDLLEDLNTPAYKIASFEIVDLPLIAYAARTLKPLIISTGMASLDEIKEATEVAREAGCTELAILRCVSSYPAPPAEYNLRTLNDMASRFKLITGLSDHTLDNTTAIASIAMGASIIEKHFTISRLGGGPDDSFSLEPDDMKALCAAAKIAWQSLGGVDYSLKPSEQENIKFRRSLYFVKNLRSGEVIPAEAVRSVRPGFGLAPKMLEAVVGATASRDIAWGTPVTLDDFDLSNKLISVIS